MELTIVDNKIKYDGSISIAVGRNRMAKEWKNQELLWSDFLRRIATTTRTQETVVEYRKLQKKQQDEIKDVGGFVGGVVTEGRRNSSSIENRTILTLDADFIKGDFWTSCEVLIEYACAVYSTHKHTSEKPRLRLIIPLSRPVTPDEYQAISRKVASDLGIDFFDDTTYQPHRLMYWPSTSRDGEFFYNVQDEPWLNPDEVLDRYLDWTDTASWPESSRVKQEHKKLADKQGDPEEKGGIVGAFCRVYDVQDVLNEFLSEIYAPAQEGRYSYLEGSTAGGLVIYENGKFAYSHHGTDPISGKLVNAFDLYRIHTFGALDEDVSPSTPTNKLPSYVKMQAFASGISEVRQKLTEEKLAQASADFEPYEEEEGTERPVKDNKWMGELQYSTKGNILNNAFNVIHILKHDPKLKDTTALNIFSDKKMVLRNLPWRKLGNYPYWKDSDDASLRNYLSIVYGIKGISLVNDALDEIQEENAFHPVLEYLDGLEWDGIERLDSLFIDYLGADDTQYTRLVTRKMLVAAVARIYVPGIKFDNVLVAVGPQGVGKSYILKKLGMDWHSDSITTVVGKEAYEQLQGTWLIEMAELSATRKAEAEAVKHFITKQEDTFRKAYGRQTVTYKRQCVFYGTTNDYTFLKDRTGNRRFWPVVVGERPIKKNMFTELSQEEIDQIWAEAKHRWTQKEPLFLNRDQELLARAAQESHTEESEMFGIIQEFLERKIPANWDSLDLYERRNFIHGSDFGEPQEGEVDRERVCALEIWCELFRNEPERFNPRESREINDILRRMPGWAPHSTSQGKLRFGNSYGRQKAFVRIF